MHRFSATGTLPASLRGGVVAIGNFDGVHRGHRAVLDTALAVAAAERRPALVLTFEPHPRAVFDPARPLFRLTPAPLKARILGHLGFAGVIEQHFDSAFAALEAHSFVADVLVGDLGAHHVAAGHDFHFGAGRKGTPAFLLDSGREGHFGVSVVEAFRDEGGETVSSSRIRTALATGDVASGAALLGYRFTVEATVSGGRRLGRTLGFPTANMALPPETALAEGVYAVRFRRASGTLHDGVASYGRRPTVEEGGAAMLETFLFDFDGDLYGETAAVSVFGRLRGEEKFDGLAPLVAQMKRDAEEARALLAGAAPLSPLDEMVCFR